MVISAVMQTVMMCLNIFFIFPVYVFVDYRSGVSYACKVRRFFRTVQISLPYLLWGNPYWRNDGGTMQRRQAAHVGWRKNEITSSTLEEDEVMCIVCCTMSYGLEPENQSA